MRQACFYRLRYKNTTSLIWNEASCCCRAYRGDGCSIWWFPRRGTVSLVQNGAVTPVADPNDLRQRLQEGMERGISTTLGQQGAIMNNSFASCCVISLNSCAVYCRCDLVLRSRHRSFGRHLYGRCRVAFAIRTHGGKPIPSHYKLW